MDIESPKNNKEVQWLHKLNHKGEYMTMVIFKCICSFFLKMTLFIQYILLMVSSLSYPPSSPISLPIQLHAFFLSLFRKRKGQKEQEHTQTQTNKQKHLIKTQN